MNVASEKAAQAQTDEMTLEALVSTQQVSLDFAKSSGEGDTIKIKGMESELIRDMKRLHALSDRACYFQSYSEKAAAEETLFDTAETLGRENTEDIVLSSVLSIVNGVEDSDSVTNEHHEQVVTVAKQVLKSKFESELDYIAKDELEQKDLESSRLIRDAETEQREAEAQLAAIKKDFEPKTNPQDWETRTKIAQLRLKLAAGRANHAKELAQQRRDRDIKICRLVAAERLSQSIDKSVQKLEHELQKVDTTVRRIEKSIGVMGDKSEKLTILSQEKTMLEKQLDVALERSRYLEEVRVCVVGELENVEESANSDQGATIATSAAMQLISDAAAMELQALLVEDMDSNSLVLPSEESERPLTPNTKQRFDGMSEEEMKIQAKRAHLKQQLTRKRNLKAKSKSANLRQQSRAIANHARAAAKNYLRIELMEDIEQAANAAATKASAEISRSASTNSNLRKRQSFILMRRRSIDDRPTSLAVAQIQRKLDASEEQLRRIHKKMKDLQQIKKGQVDDGLNLKSMELLQLQEEVSKDIFANISAQLKQERKYAAQQLQKEKIEMEREIAAEQLKRKYEVEEHRKRAAVVSKRKADLMKVKANQTSDPWAHHSDYARGVVASVVEAQRAQFNLVDRNHHHWRATEETANKVFVPPPPRSMPSQSTQPAPPMSMGKLNTYSEKIGSATMLLPPPSEPSFSMSFSSQKAPSNTNYLEVNSSQVARPRKLPPIKSSSTRRSSRVEERTVLLHTVENTEV